MYQWTLSSFPKFGWFFCLLFAICMAMRLARFNTMLEDEPQPVYWQNFFVGVPAPAAAALGILPIMLSFEFPEATFLRSDWFCCVVMCVVAMLMVSRIPTVSTKHMKVPTYLVVPLIIVVVLFATMIISSPWLVLSVSTGLYALSIPVGVLFSLRPRGRPSGAFSRKSERKAPCQSGAFAFSFFGVGKVGKKSFSET